MKTRIPSHKLRPRGVRGVSLAEVLVGGALSLMALSALYAFQVAQARSLAVENTYNDSQNITRTAIDLMSRELRMATYDPSGLALTTSLPPICPGVKQGITEAAVNRIHFRQDLNGDGLLLGAGEDVVYDVSGTDLRRTDGLNAPVAIVTGIPSGGFALRYFDGSNPPVEIIPGGIPPQLNASQRDCVAKVRMTITANLANPNPKITTPVLSQAETEIAIRNRSLGNF